MCQQFKTGRVESSQRVGEGSVGAGPGVTEGGQGDLLGDLDPLVTTVRELGGSGRTRTSVYWKYFESKLEQ